MKRKPQKPISLKMPAEETFLPLAAAFVSQSAKGLGLDEEAAEELALATEEVVAYLTGLGVDGRDVAIDCKAGSCFIETHISLPVRDMQLKAFNMTARVNAEDEAGLDQMGLLIASRMTDRFRISRPASGNLVLSLVKERSYPAMETDTPLQVPARLSRFHLEAPDAARIKWFVRLVNQCYAATHFPAAFRYPGKIADMAAGGDCHLLLAIGPAGEIGGGLAWKWEGTQTVAFYGPYLFGEQDSEMACDLLEGCIAAIARTSALVLVNRMPTAQLPEGYLEILGTLDTRGPDGEPVQLTAQFRLMHEDTGAVVWAHPDLEGFLHSEYRRLVFPRDIQPVRSDGEAGEPVSVLSVETDRRLGIATLRPIWPGQDCAENLAAHVALLRREALTEIFFEMDLGLAWQAGFTPGLLELGFRPRMILPYAGAADRVVFQLGADS
jgi:anti-sigma regulatory factor (Ser/Thr protein kinase)